MSEAGFIPGDAAVPTNLSQPADAALRPATPGRALRNVMAARDVTTFIGIHDAFSATIAGQYYDAIFVSGYGFAASHYGLPDVGFIAWTDMVALVTRLRTILPRHHILVDMDDGYGDPEIAAHVAVAMEQAGASGIVLEDQQRPRRCGHAPGKQVLPLEQYLQKLERVLASRRDLVVVARTDAADDDERVRRCEAFDAAGADAVLADGIADIAVVTRIANRVRRPVMFNQIAGGRSPRCTLSELRAAGVSMVNYSTPCLFAAAEAIDAALQSLKSTDGLLPDTRQAGRVGVSWTTQLLSGNVVGPPAVDHGLSAGLPYPITPPATIEQRIAKLSPVKQRLLAVRRRGAGGARGEFQPIISRSAHSAAPLSRAQHWFWVAAQIAPDGVSLNTIRGFRLVGPLEMSRLEAALAQVVQRHAILRTVYLLPVGYSSPVQQCEATGAIALPLTDLSHLPEADRESAVQCAIAKDAREPFRLASGPVYRVGLTRFGQNEHLFTLAIHHVAFDGWSAGIFMSDLAAAYAAWPVELTPPALQYADYATWQRSNESTAVADVAAAYWTKQLAGLTPVRLPTDRPRPAYLSSAGARLTVVLPTDLVYALRDLAKAHGATLFMVLLTGWKALLHRLTGQTDLVIGSHVAARERVEFESLIGPFMNTLVLRTRFAATDTFADLLAQVRGVTVDALRHAAISYDRLVREVNPPRDPSRNPLYDIAFQLRNFPKPTAEAGELHFESVELDNGVCRTDLQLMADEHDGGIDLIFEYCTELFDGPTIRRLGQQLSRVLQTAVTNPRIPLAEILPLPQSDSTSESAAAPEPLQEREQIAVSAAINADERRTILEQFNRPVPKTGGTVLDLWQEQVRRDPNATAVCFGGKSLSYAQLDARAGALAAELICRGVAIEDRVGLYLRRSVDTMAALLGVMKAGAAYVPLDPSYPAERLAMMLEDGGVKVVLSDAGETVQPLLAGRNVLPIDRGWPAGTAGELPVVRPEQLAYVLFTSGSTGRPKGVAMAHGPAWHLARWQRKHSACNAGTRTLQFTSLNFDVSFQEIFSTWCGGGTLVLIDDQTRRDPEALLSHIVNQRVDRLFLPFVALQGLADAAVKPSAPRAMLAEVMTAGEQLRITPAIAQWFAAMPDCKLFNQYGPTETHVINTSLELTGDPTQWPALPSIGRPIEGSRLYVLGDQRELLPIGSPGQLYIGGAGLARGYLNRPDLTGAAFFDDPFAGVAGARMYRTGDLAQWNADGTIQYLGRSDTQVKIQGYRVELGEIETALSKIDGVSQAVVVPRDDAAGSKRLIAYLVTDAPLEVKALRRALGVTLPAYMLPAAFVRLDAMPLTASNKIDRAGLPDPAVANATNAERGPANEIERGLLAIWQDVLGLGDIDLDDNYFDIGGQSLQAVRVFALIEKRLGRALPLSVLFTSPTIAQLALRVCEAERVGGDDVAIPLQSDGNGPPLFCLAGINGHVFNFRSLAKKFKGVRPVYGLQVEGLAGDRAALGTVEAIAAFLLIRVRRVQPHGPYALIGYSFGGTVAFEMAQQLRAAGERVEMLAMLDTFATAVFPRKSLARRGVIHARRLATAGPTLAGRYLRKRAERLIGRLAGTTSETLASQPAGESTAVTQAIHRVRLASDRALRQYTPRPYDGTITLFRAASRPTWYDFVVDSPQNGWERLTARVDVVTVPGTHLTLLEEAGAGQIAAALRDPHPSVS